MFCAITCAHSDEFTPRNLSVSASLPFSAGRGRRCTDLPPSYQHGHADTLTSAGVINDTNDNSFITAGAHRNTGQNRDAIEVRVRFPIKAPDGRMQDVNLPGSVDCARPRAARDQRERDPCGGSAHSFLLADTRGSRENM